MEQIGTSESARQRSTQSRCYGTGGAATDENAHVGAPQLQLYIELGRETSGDLRITCLWRGTRAYEVM